MEGGVGRALDSLLLEMINSFYCKMTSLMSVAFMQWNDSEDCIFLPLALLELLINLHLELFHFIFKYPHNGPLDLY